MNFLHRLCADQKYDSGYQNNDKNYTWQREMEHDYHGKPRVPGQTLPPETFTKSGSEIAHTLKQHSKDFKQAMSKLSSYINRQGKNLQGADKERLYSAKDALRQAYGETTANSEFPIYALPPGHNLDDGYLDTGFDDIPEENPHEEVTDMAVPLNAAARLLGSIYNTVQDPSSDTSISSVTADKWSQKVTEHDNHNAVPDGTFEKSAEDIAKTLKRVSKDHKQASERLNFYSNRGGKNVDQSKMKHASEILKGLYEK